VENGPIFRGTFAEASNSPQEQRMDPGEVQVIARDNAYNGYFRIDRYRLKHRLFDGGTSPEIRREVFDRGQAVAVILYDPGRDAVVLIDQFRIGALAAGHPPWVTEIVAGVIDPGETPVEVARRETLEETGCAVDDLILVHDYLVSPGCSNETVKLFCGRIDATNAGGVFGLKDEGEDIRVRAVPLDDALQALESGQINTSLGIIGLQWLALNRQKLRSGWKSAAIPRLNAGPCHR
jgi:ADP-ribose pyrophosphatase